MVRYSTSLYIYIYVEMIVFLLFFYIFQSILIFLLEGNPPLKKKKSLAGFRPKPQWVSFWTRFLWQENHGLRFYGMLKKHSAWPVPIAGICYQETWVDWTRVSRDEFMVPLGVRTHPQKKAPQGESCELIYFILSSSVRNSRGCNFLKIFVEGKCWKKWVLLL